MRSCNLRSYPSILLLGQHRFVVRNKSDECLRFWPTLTLDLVGLGSDAVLLCQLGTLGDGCVVADRDSVSQRSATRLDRSSCVHPSAKPPHLLYHNAMSAPASSMASATEYPIPSLAPVMQTTLPFMLNCSNTLEGVLDTGRACRGAAQSSIVIDIVCGGVQRARKERKCEAGGSG